MLSRSDVGIQRELSGNVALNVVAAGLSDGETITIQDGSGNTLVFQFVDIAAAVPATLLPGRIAVNVRLTGPAADRSSAEQIATALQSSINSNITAGRLRLPPVVLDGTQLTIHADDDDGVTFSGVFNPEALPVTVSVVASNAGYLDAWIDWNQDNDFDDANEQMITSIPVVAGINTFSFTTPADAEVGFTTARFRLSTTGGLSPTGFAIGGEVEDHLIEVLGGSPPIAVNDPSTPAGEYRVLEDGVLNVDVDNGVLANDLPATGIWVYDADPFTGIIDPIVAPANGTLEFIVQTTGPDAGKPLGAFRYTPNRNFTGIDTFVYQVRNERMNSNVPATVTINVLPVNDSPVGIDDYIAIWEDNEDVLINPNTSVVWDGSLFTANDIRGRHTDGQTAVDENGQLMRVIAAEFVSAPRTGESISVDVATGKITYTPGHHYNSVINGPIIVRLTVEDEGVDGVIGANDSNNATPTFVTSRRTSTNLLTIHINPTNDRPVFTLDSNTLTEVEDPTPAMRVHDIVKNVAPGPALATDELASQAVVSFSINVLTNHPDPSALFTVAPHIVGTGSNRQLVYALAPDLNWANVGGDLANQGNLGDIRLEIVAVDNGSDEAPLNLNRSLVQTLTIRIQPVNDAPEFTIPATHTSAEDAGVVTVPDFATNIRSGTTTSSDETRDQTTQFRVVSYDTNFFASAPTISPTGTLIYEVRSNLNRNYTNLVSTPAVNPVLNPVIVVELVDDGPTGGSNVNVSIQKSFTVDITPVNDAPVLVPYATAAHEDTPLNVTAAAVLASSSVGPVDERVTEGQVNRITRVDLATAQGGTIVPEVDTTTGQILSFVYHPAANYFGEDSITYSVTDNGNPERTTDHTIVFNVSSVNDAPIFTPGANVVVLEDSAPYNAPWATGIAPGPDNELSLEGQTVHFELTATPPALYPNFFAVAPAISVDGVLSFTLAPDATGSAIVEVVLVDNGLSGGPNNHTNRSAVHLLTITASPVNDTPVFTLSQTQVTDSEDSSPALKSLALITGVAPSRSTAVDELADQTVTFEVTANIATSNFIVAPRVVGTGANRSLEYQLAENVNQYTVGGSIVFTIVAIDSGDSTTPPANVNRSEPQSVTLTISETNDAPLFNILFENLTIAEDSPLQSISGFYRDVVAGPATAIDELSGARAEIVDVTVSVNPAALPFFTVPPTLNANGDLQFQLRQDANSDFATTLGIPDLFDISITATDNGTDAGVAAPRSTTRVLKLTITPVNDAPFFTLPETRVTVVEDQGVVEIPNFAQQIRPAFTLVNGELLAIDELSQNLEFVLTVGNQTLFAEIPTIDSNGRLRFRTAPDQNGTSIITARLLDSGAAGPAPNNNVGPIVTFTVLVNAINDAPQFDIPTQLTVAEDAGVVSVNGFATDIRPGPETAIDENRQTLSFTLVSFDPNLFEIAPTLQADGTLSFKTRLDVNSSTPGINRTVSFRLTDNGLGTPAPNSNQSVVKTFTLNITPVNDAPVPDVHEVTAIEDTPLTITATAILAGDLAGPVDEVNAGQTTRITQVEATSQLGGTVTSVVENGRILSIQYIPPANAVGDDYVRYVVTDNGSPEQSATGVIHIKISPVNDAPQFTAGPNLTLNEDAAPYRATWATNILAGPANATDESTGPNAQVVSFTLTPRTNGFFAVAPAIDANGVLTFQLGRDVNGSVIVEVVAEDNGPRGTGHAFRSATHLLTISVTPLNDPPGFVLGNDITLQEDSGPYSAIFVTSITGAEGQNSTPPTGTDEPLGRVQFEVTNNNNALFSVQPSIDSNGRLVFTPAENASGIVEVYVVGVDDGASTPPNTNRSAAKTFTIHLESVNDAPLAVADRYTTDEDTPVVVSAPGLLANDRDVDLPDDAISVIVPGTPLVSRLGAAVTLNADGSFRYDPTNAAQVQRLGAGQEVVDTFTYFIQDRLGVSSNAGTVSITITGSNDAPVAVNDSFQINAQAVTSLNVLANDTDVDSTIDARTVEIGRMPANGTVIVLSSGRIDYRPNANFVGEDSFTYWVRDAQGLASNPATVTVYSSIQPVAVNDLFSMVKGREIVLDVLSNDHDPDPAGGLDPTSVQIARAPDVGTATVGPDGKITYRPTPDFVGTASFQYFVTDLTGQPSNVATVTIRVLGSLHQNPDNHMDVNADGFISPIDVLIIVNDINYRGSRMLPDDFVTPPYIDVNGNGGVDPLDALMVINYLNARGSAGAGGEGENFVATPVQESGSVLANSEPQASSLNWSPIDVEILSSDRYRQLAEEKWIEFQTEVLNSALDEESSLDSFAGSERTSESSDDWFSVLAGQTSEEVNSHDLALTTDFWDEL